MNLDFSTEAGVVHFVLLLLGCFSLLTWSVILLKLGEWVFNTYRNYFFISTIKNTSDQPFHKISDLDMPINITNSQFDLVYH